jgi:hypothetical protein
VYFSVLQQHIVHTRLPAVTGSLERFYHAHIQPDTGRYLGRFLRRSIRPAFHLHLGPLRISERDGIRITHCRCSNNGILLLSWHEELARVCTIFCFHIFQNFLYSRRSICLNVSRDFHCLFLATFFGISSYLLSGCRLKPMMLRTFSVYLHHAN